MLSLNFNTETYKMKNTKILIALSIVALCITSCKKENVQPFKPGGFWDGTVYMYHTAILNRENGQSRIFFRILGTDTTNTSITADGVYTVSGSSFKARYFFNGDDTLFLESRSVSADLITGKYFSTLTPEVVDFELQRQ
jgi:hypothetical protein